MLTKAILIVSLLAAQNTVMPGKLDIYSPLPASDRDSFRIGLDKFVALEEQGKWDELFPLYDNEENVTLKQFVKGNRGLIPLLQFTPVRVTFIPPANSWEVEGCATFARPTSGKKSEYSTVHGRKSSNGWRFSMVAIEVLDRDDPPPIDCNAPRR